MKSVNAWESDDGKLVSKDQIDIARYEKELRVRDTWKCNANSVMTDFEHIENVDDFIKAVHTHKYIILALLEFNK